MLKAPFQGLSYCDESIDNKREIAFHGFIENDCNLFDASEFLSTHATIPLCAPKLYLYRHLVRQSKFQKAICKDCAECGKDVKSSKIFCTNCGFPLHPTCVKTAALEYFSEQSDPYHNSTAHDFMNAETVHEREENIDFIETDFSDKGYFNASKQFEGILCNNCFTQSCQICHQCQDTVQCTKCKQYFHQSCQVQSDSKELICQYCKVDGGENLVDKIVSVKVVSRDALRQIVKNQYNILYKMSYDEFVEKNKNYYYQESLITMSDRVLFLCKMRQQSYWRVQWITLTRMKVVSKQLLFCNNLAKPLYLYYGLIEQYGIDTAVGLKSINDGQDEEEKNEEEEISNTSETQIDINIEPNIQDSAQVAPRIQELEQFFKIPSADYLLESLDGQIKSYIRAKFEGISYEIEQKMQQLKQELVQAGVRSDFLEAQVIVARYNDAYQIKWKGLPFDDSCFESLYFIYPQAKQAIVSFLLEQIDCKHYTFLRTILIPFDVKPWWDKEQIQLPLGSYRKLIAMPPYLSLEQKQLFAFQLIGINWMLFCHLNAHGCLFCDEMGLGKTIQVCGLLAALAEYGSFGTHLIICPTSTLENWYRELNKWLPFYNIGMISITDIESIELILQQQNKKPDKNQFDLRDCNKLPTQNINNSRARLLNLVQQMLDSHQYVNFSDDKQKQLSGQKHYNILLLSYESMANFQHRQFSDGQEKKQSIFKLICNSFGPFSTLICDEGHKLKGGSNLQFFKILNQIQAVQRIILTGTPIQNNFGELLNLLEFIEPNIFNSKKQNELYSLADKASSISQSNSEENIKALKEIHEIIRPYVLIRQQCDVFDNVIPKVEQYIPVDLTSIQKQLYGKLIYDNRKKLNGELKLNINLVMQLRHVSNHPLLLNKNYFIQLQKLSTQQIIGMSAKMLFFDKILSQLIEQKRKILVYSQFKMMLDVIEVYSQKQGFTYLRIDGDVSGIDRQLIIDKFNDFQFKIQLLLLSTNAGGIGINLQAASDVVIFDPSWNPQNDIQAIHRAARLGQQNVVRVYKLFCRDSIDQKIVERAKLKLSRSYIFVRPIVDKNTDDINQIIAFGCKNIMETFKDTIKNKTFEQIQEQAMKQQENDAQICYSNENITELINVKVDSNQQQRSFDRSNIANIDRNSFFSGFKCATFQVVQENLQYNEESNYTPSKARHSRQLVINNEEKNVEWKNMFENIFGQDEEELKAEIKRQEALNRRIAAVQQITDSESSSDFEMSDKQQYTENKLAPSINSTINQYQKSNQLIYSEIRNNNLQQAFQPIQKLVTVAQVLPVVWYSPNDFECERDFNTKQVIEHEPCNQDQSNLIIKAIIDGDSILNHITKSMFQSVLSSKNFPVFCYNNTDLVFKYNEVLKNIQSALNGSNILGKFGECMIYQNKAQVIQLLNLDQNQAQYINNSNQLQVLFNQAEQNMNSKICYVFFDIFQVVEQNNEYQIQINQLSKWKQMSFDEYQQLIYDPKYQQRIHIFPHLVSFINPELYQNELVESRNWIFEVYKQLCFYYRNIILKQFSLLATLISVINKLKVRQSLLEMYQIFNRFANFEENVTNIAGMKYMYLQKLFFLCEQPSEIQKKTGICTIEQVQEQLKHISFAVQQQLFVKKLMIPVAQISDQQFLDFYYSKDAQQICLDSILFMSVIFQCEIIPQSSIQQQIEIKNIYYKSNKARPQQIQTSNVVVNSQLSRVNFGQSYNVQQNAANRNSVQPIVKQENAENMKPITQKLVQSNHQESQNQQSIQNQVQVIKNVIMVEFKQYSFSPRQYKMQAEASQLEQVCKFTQQYGFTYLGQLPKEIENIFNYCKIEEVQSELQQLQLYFIDRMYVNLELISKQIQCSGKINELPTIEYINQMSAQELIANIYHNFFQVQLRKMTMLNGFYHQQADIVKNLIEFQSFISLINDEEKRLQIIQWVQQVVKFLSTNEQQSKSYQFIQLLNGSQMELIRLIVGLLLISLHQFGLSITYKKTCLNETYVRLVDTVHNLYYKTQTGVLFAKELSKSALKCSNPLEIVMALNISGVQKLQMLVQIIYYEVTRQMILSNSQYNEVEEYIVSREEGKEGDWGNSNEGMKGLYEEMGLAHRMLFQ